MKCKFCGAEIEIDSKFCQYCGKQLSKEDAQNNLSVLMTIENCFSVTGRGTVVTGILNKGVKVGDTVRNKRTNMSYQVYGIEINRKIKKSASQNENCGLLIMANKNDIATGDELVLVK